MSYPERYVNITKVAGTAQTRRDWSADLAKLQNLDTKLSKATILAEERDKHIAKAKEILRRGW